MGEFGDKFRKAREKKELSLDDVSNVTKIGSRMLRAIEEEHFDDLPGGVFNKGFIRAYAKHLGLDAEDAVSDYLACLDRPRSTPMKSGNRSARAMAIHAPRRLRSGHSSRPMSRRRMPLKGAPLKTSLKHEK